MTNSASRSVTGAGLDVGPRRSATAVVSLSIFSSSRLNRWSVVSPGGACAAVGLAGNSSQAPASATAKAQKLVRADMVILLRVERYDTAAVGCETGKCTSPIRGIKARQTPPARH